MHIMSSSPVQIEVKKIAKLSKTTIKLIKNHNSHKSPIHKHIARNKTQNYPSTEIGGQKFPVQHK